MDRRTTEWLEADGLGGFASGTVEGVRTRRYHALLLAATTPPTGRVVLVNGFDAWLDLPEGSIPLTTQAYEPGVLHPDGATRIAAFEDEPWPRWTLEAAEGVDVVHELFVPAGRPLVALSWRLWNVPGRRVAPGGRAILRVRPFLSGRDAHALHVENPDFRFEAEIAGDRVTWRPYPTLPAITAVAGGAYRHAPEWYRRFEYAEELARGLGAVEDLASPGEFTFDLTRGEATLLLAAGPADELADLLPAGASAEAVLAELRRGERRRRRRFGSRLERAADAYLVRRGAGRSIVAGYPWFTDWGRDTFVALRGLCLATGRLDDARAILLQWAGALSEGMLPNRFPEWGEEPEFHSVDAPLWFAVTVFEYLKAVEGRSRRLGARQRRTLLDAVAAILEGYATGTRFGIRLDEDGLIAAGEPGLQLTWMDARSGGRVVTPRIGKPVEVQALWLNALRFAADIWPRWDEVYSHGLACFRERFWDDEAGHLADVVDVDHEPGTRDMSFRPNQLLAVGGLPFMLLDGARARRLVQQAEERLWTRLGPRSLAPGEPGYAGRYEGGPAERDAAYHQGTVWPWLAGAFIEAWVRVNGGTQAARAEARARFLHPLVRHLDEAGLGHISEIADGDPPHTPRGCPFQAWSVGEALRVRRGILSELPAEGSRPRGSSTAASAGAPAPEAATAG